MQINSINNLNFGKIVFKDGTKQYIMEEVVPSIIRHDDFYCFKDKFDKVSELPDTTLTVEKLPGRYGNYLLMGIEENGEYVKTDFAYCTKNGKCKKEIFNTFLDMLDFALYRQKD